jgi:hypothetical protein
MGQRMIEMIQGCMHRPLELGNERIHFQGLVELLIV